MNWLALCPPDTSKMSDVQVRICDPRNDFSNAAFIFNVIVVVYCCAAQKDWVEFYFVIFILFSIVSGISLFLSPLRTIFRWFCRSSDNSGAANETNFRCCASVNDIA